MGMDISSKAEEICAALGYSFLSVKVGQLGEAFFYDEEFSRIAELFDHCLDESLPYFLFWRSSYALFAQAVVISTQLG